MRKIFSGCICPEASPVETGEGDYAQHGERVGFEE